MRTLISHLDQTGQLEEIFTWTPIMGWRRGDCNADLVNVGKPGLRLRRGFLLGTRFWTRGLVSSTVAAVAELAGGELRIVVRVLDDLLNGPHGDQITGALVLPSKALAGRDDPQPISGQKISEDTVLLQMELE
jgi:hypothetical protein